MPIQAVIFDMDGTLGDTLPVVDQAFQDTLLRFTGRHFTPEEIHAHFGPSEDGMLRALVRPADFDAALDCYFQRYAELHRAINQPFPGVIDLLQQLRARGLHTAIVTGKGPHTAQISMDVLGLSPYIEELKAGTPGGAGKPAALRELLAAWDLPAAHAIYVGDMPYDMQASREVGLLPIGAAWAVTATVRDGDGAAMLFTRVADLSAWLLPQLGVD
jgi:phosphoglycolate phosphatase-like HAD superfamily hydrolase